MRLGGARQCPSLTEQQKCVYTGREMETNAVRCGSCGSCDIRRAKLRFADAIFLVRKQYPIRCRYCRVRGSCRISEALLLEPFYHYGELGPKPQPLWSRALGLRLRQSDRPLLPASYKRLLSLPEDVREERP
jgi:hypothetical protein